jgi:hypothetical protein
VVDSGLIKMMFRGGGFLIIFDEFVTMDWIKNVVGFLELLVGRSINTELIFL